MNRKPLALALLAVVLFLSGVAWVIVTGVAVPFPDPTPAMRAHEVHHWRIANALMLGGAVAFVIAIVWGAVASVQHRRASRRAA